MMKNVYVLSLFPVGNFEKMYEMSIKMQETFGNMTDGQID